MTATTLRAVAAAALCCAVGLLALRGLGELVGLPREAADYPAGILAGWLARAAVARVRSSTPAR